MSISITCAAKQSKGPFPVARNAAVALSVTTGGSASVVYCNQPAAAGEPYVTWPMGLCTTPEAEIDIAENNYLAQVICTAGTATLTISDPDPVNNLPYNNWKSQSEIPLINSSNAGQLVGSNGSTLTFLTGGTTSSPSLLPTINSSVAWDALYNNGTTASWGPRVDWFLVASTATLACLQSTVNQALAAGTAGLGYPTVILVPGMKYDMGPGPGLSISIPSANVTYGGNTTGYIGGFKVMCPGMCAFDGSAFTSQVPIVTWTNAVSASNLGFAYVFEGVLLTGGADDCPATGITTKGSYITLKHIDFQFLKRGWFLNEAPGDTFSEHTTGEHLNFRTNVQEPIVFDRVGSGQKSFRGCGLVGTNFVAANSNVTSVARYMINIGNNCIVYNAPLYVDIHTANTPAPSPINFDGYFLVNNGSSILNTNFYGNICAEVSRNYPLTGGRTASFNFNGNINVNRNQFRAGTMRINNRTITTYNEASLSGTEIPLISEYETLQDGAMLNGQGSYTTPWSVHGLSEIVVKIQDTPSGYDCRYVLDCTAVASQIALDAGSLMVSKILFEHDGPGLGTFSDGQVYFRMINGIFNTIASINAPGTLYTIGDVLTPFGGTGFNARLQVDTVDGGGGILTASVLSPGTGYAGGGTVNVSVLGGTGSGATFTINLVANGSGLLTVYAPNLINTNVLLQIDAAQKTQPQFTTDNLQQFRHDLSYVCKWDSVAYLNSSTITVSADASGGAAFSPGRGQSTAYLATGTAFYLFDTVNIRRVATVVSNTLLGDDTANVVVDITVDPTTFGLGIGTI